MSLTTLCNYVEKLCAADDAIVMKHKLQTTAEELEHFATNRKLLSQCLTHLNERALNDGKFAIKFALLVSSVPLKSFSIDGLHMRSAMITVLQANFENAKSFKAANIMNFFNSITLLGEYHSRELDNTGAPFVPIANGLCDALSTEICYRIENYKRDKVKQSEEEFAKLLIAQIGLNGLLLKTFQKTSIDNLLFEMRRYLIEVPNLEDSTKAFLMMSFDLYYNNFKGLGTKLDNFYTKFLLASVDEPSTQQAPTSNHIDQSEVTTLENQTKITTNPPVEDIEPKPHAPEPPQSLPSETKSPSGKTTPLSPMSPPSYMRIEPIGNWCEELETERNGFHSLTIEETSSNTSQQQSPRRNSMSNSEIVASVSPRERRNFRQRRDSSTHSRHSTVDHRPSSRNQQYNNSNNSNNSYHHHNQNNSSSNNSNYSHYRSANDVSNASRVSSRLDGNRQSRRSDLSFNNHYQPPKGGGQQHQGSVNGGQSQPQKPPRFNIQNNNSKGGGNGNNNGAGGGGFQQNFNRFPRRRNDSISSEGGVNISYDNNGGGGGGGNYQQKGNGGYRQKNNQNGGNDRRGHRGGGGGNQRGGNGYRPNNNRNQNYHDRNNHTNGHADNSFFNPTNKDTIEHWEEPESPMQSHPVQKAFLEYMTHAD